MNKIPITEDLKKRIIYPLGEWMGSLMMAQMPDKAEEVFMLMESVSRKINEGSEIDESLDVLDFRVGAFQTHEYS